MLTGVGVLIEQDDAILMFYHNKHKLWTIPIGKPEGQEPWGTALKREAQEELGITIRGLRYVDHGIFTWQGMTIQAVTYRAVAFENIPFNKEPDKHRLLKWFPKQQVKRFHESRISLCTKLIQPHL